MKTDPIEDYILKSEHNLRIAAAVSEAWPDAREKLVSAFFDRLDTRLKRKLKRWEFGRSGGRFFEAAYPGYFFWKPTWKRYDLVLECQQYGEQMFFGVMREEQLLAKGSLSGELLKAIQIAHPSAHADSWWVGGMILRAPAPDWRKPEVIWQMHKGCQIFGKRSGTTLGHGKNQRTDY